MKAARYYGIRDLRVEEVNKPELNPDGVLIKVKATGICGSDLHPYKAGGLLESGEIAPGLIMGHEFAGDVVEVGNNVNGIKVGDRVTAHPALRCSTCDWCRSGHYNRCTNMGILGFNAQGAYAEYVNIPLAVLDETIFLLPEGFSYQDGALIEPLSTGANVAMRAEPKPEDVAVVLGAGIIGLTTMQALKALGAGKVVVTDISQKRLEVAKATGADMVINAAEEDPVKIVREITSEAGADIVAECAGTPATFGQALEMVRVSIQQTFETQRPDPRIMIVAAYEQPIQWDPIVLLTGNVRMIGTFSGGFPLAIDLIKTGKVNVKPFVSHEISLLDAKDAFEIQANPDESVKVLVMP